ncbi:MAG TPA: hypothetical protein VGO45_11925 [Bacteroidia bacterium]|jgi:hypothetical protein|nr:hypothetical protein [Bacteroidia bacterium]
MLIGSFKTYTPVAIVKIPLFGLFLWAFSPLYRYLPLVATGGGMPLYEAMASGLNHYFLLSAFISLLLSTLSAFLLNYIVNQHNLLPKKTYLPALFYLIYSGFCGELLTIHPASFANLLIIAACHELFDTYRKDSALSEVFNAGMLIGLASLLFLPSLLLLFFIWAALLLYRPFIWQEYLVSFLGLLLPWAYLLVYFFWYDRLGILWNTTLHNHLIIKQFIFQKGPAFVWLYFVFGTVLFFSLFRLLNSPINPPLKSQKTFSVLFWCFLISILSLTLSPVINLATLDLAAVPLAVFTANLFLQLRKSWIAELFFTFLLLAILIIHLSVFMSK